MDIFLYIALPIIVFFYYLYSAYSKKKDTEVRLKELDIEAKKIELEEKRITSPSHAEKETAK